MGLGLAFAFDPGLARLAMLAQPAFSSQLPRGATSTAEAQGKHRRSKGKVSADFADCADLDKRGGGCGG
jgi:hypothetical protein